AGLRTGDKVLRVNEISPRHLIELYRELITQADDREFTLTIQRGRDRKNISVRLIPELEFFNAKLVREKIGASLQEMSAEVAARFGLRAGDGLLVAGVDKNTPADHAELKRGHVIQSMDGQTVSEIRDVAKILYAKKPGEKVQLGLVIQRTRGAFVQLFRATVEVNVL
ncbi:MAG: PDZ domain-containing protein, partial [Verrucomicrobiota bacterium]